jgi:hypothetical protein
MEQDRTVGESRQGEKREGNNEWNRKVTTHFYYHIWKRRHGIAGKCL